MSDLDRLRKAYATRAESAPDKGHNANRQGDDFIIRQRTEAIESVLNKYHLLPLRHKHVLEVGCGDGGVLTQWQQYVDAPNHLHGLDLLEYRVQVAHRILPESHITCANGQALPYASNRFDIVLQFTAFSSILDRAIQQQMAFEMRRVLRNEGIIVWYDFWLNPTNPHTVGIRANDIRQLFPNAIYAFHRITLAPPIARALVPLSYTLAQFLEKMRFLNTHYLAIIWPKSKL